MSAVAILAALADLPEPPQTPAKKSNHQANIVRIGELRPHPNADTLDLLDIGGYQVVVKKGDFRSGDLAIYIQPDSVVPQTEPFRFIWQENSGPEGTLAVPEKKRRITVRRFRGEWSEGLLMPLYLFLDELSRAFSVSRMDFHASEGMDVSDALGITHYDPEPEQADQTNAPKRKRPKSLRGWFFYIWHKLTGKGRKKLEQEVSFQLPTYDVEAYKNHLRVFSEGDPVIVTEKIHGSNARFVCVDGVMYAGSRKQWKAPESGTVWHKALRQNPWIEEWCRSHPGVALYGEVTPTQKGFNYGCGDGQARFFLFNIWDEGKWVLQNQWDSYDLPPQAEFAPIIYQGPWLTERIYNFVDGNSFVIGAKHIREGVVVTAADGRRVRGLGLAQLKLVSNKFLEKDSK